MNDLEQKVIRTIGDSDERFEQDPVRMIRVIRHAARTGFPIEDQTFQAILRHQKEIRMCSPSRLRDEFLRELKEGVAKSSLQLMLQTGLLFSLFPDLERALGNQSLSGKKTQQFFLSLFDLVDQLTKTGRPYPNRFFLPFSNPFSSIRHTRPSISWKKRKYHYMTQTIRWSAHQILTPFSFPRGSKEMACQILMAQSMIKKKYRGESFLKD